MRHVHEKCTPSTAFFQSNFHICFKIFTSRLACRGQLKPRCCAAASGTADALGEHAGVDVGGWMWTGQFEEASIARSGSLAVALGDGEGFTAVFGLFDDEETRTSVLGVEKTPLLVSRGRLRLTSKHTLLFCRLCSPPPPFKQKVFPHHSTTAEKNERTHFKNAAPGLRPFAVSMFLPVFLLSQRGCGRTSP